MKSAYKMLATAALAATSFVGGNASAATVTYTNQATFNAATSGDTLYGFTFAGEANLSPSYTNGPVTFTSNKLFSFNDAYGKPYISDENATGSSSNSFTIASTTSALGLFLGSYYGGATYSYIVNGVAGSITVPVAKSTTFLGFTSTSGPVSVAFSVAGGSGFGGANIELDVPQFIAGDAIMGAVPEPATWAMMLLGFGGIGVAMRRRPKVTERLSHAG